MIPNLTYLVSQCRKDLPNHTERAKHWAILCNARLGYSRLSARNKTEPIPQTLRSYYPPHAGLHAEANLLMRSVNQNFQNEPLILVTIRLLANGQTAISKPCDSCMALILASPLNILTVYSSLNILSSSSLENWLELPLRDQMNLL